MHQKILTIIVPSYNTSGYINKNIPTFLGDRILDELEVIIVNDGSSDSTCEVAKQFENRYPNTVRVIDKENGGHGSVINVGIQKATGIYLKVVDGDDWVITENLCRLIDDLKDQDADIVINPYHYVYARSQRTKFVSTNPANRGKNMRFQDAGVCNQHLKLPSITYKTELLKKNNIHVRERVYYEDNEYSLFPLPFIETISIFDYPVYQYLIAQDNQSVSNSSFLKNQDMFYIVVKDCIEYYEKYKNKLPREKRMIMKKAVMDLIRSQYNIYLRAASDPKAFEDLRCFNEDFRKNHKIYYIEIGKRDKYISIVQKENRIWFFIISQAMRIYRLFFRW